jgi:hypothetical protein
MLGIASPAASLLGSTPQSITRQLSYRMSPRRKNEKSMRYAFVSALEIDDTRAFAARRMPGKQIRMGVTDLSC